MKKKKLTNIIVFLIIITIAVVLYYESDGNNTVLDRNGYYESKFAKMSKTEWSLVNKAYCGYENVDDLMLSLDENIIEIEKILGRENWRKEYQELNGEHFDSSIEIRFVYGISRALGGGVGESYYEPIVKYNRSLFENGKAPIIHELTHIIAPNTRSISLSEGLACYIQDKLGGNPTFPNHGGSVHLLAKLYLETETRQTLDYIGNTNESVQDIYNTIGEERKSFYIYSSSFTTYLIEKEGIETYLKVYSSNEPLKEYEIVYGKSREELIDNWLEFLKREYQANI